MNKTALLLLLLLISVSVNGEDRLADTRPGSPCETIPEIEKRLGSLELELSDSTGISRYSGIQGGREAAITYRCADGSLAEQTITVTVVNRAEALRYADAQKIELAKRLGDPIHDGLHLAIWRKLLFGILGADLDYLTAVVVWGREKQDVMLQVSQTAENLWQVSISQGGSKLEYILNS